MDKTLTKSAIKKELTRRIEWLETKYGFGAKNYHLPENANKRLLIARGRYLALYEMRWQITERVFIDGFLA